MYEHMIHDIYICIYTYKVTEEMLQQLLTAIITVTDDDTDTDDDADDTIYIQHHFTIDFNLKKGVITLINHSKMIKNTTKKI